MSFGHRKIPKHLIIEDFNHRKRHHSSGWIILAATILLLSMWISQAATPKLTSISLTGLQPSLTANSD